MLALAGSEGCLESGRVLVARQRRRQIRGGRIQEKKNNFLFLQRVETKSRILKMSKVKMHTLKMHMQHELKS